METLQREQLTSLKTTFRSLGHKTEDLSELYSELKHRGRVTTNSLLTYLYDEASLSPSTAASLQKLFPGLQEITRADFCTKIGALDLADTSIHVSDFGAVESPKVKKASTDDWDWPELTKKYQEAPDSGRDRPKVGRQLEWEVWDTEQEISTHEKPPVNFEQQWRQIEEQTEVPRKVRPKSLQSVSNYSALSELRNRYIKHPETYKPSKLSTGSSIDPRFFLKLNAGHVKDKSIQWEESRLRRLDASLNKASAYRT